MKKLTVTALGIGVAYLMKNKDARSKFMQQIESFSGRPSKKSHTSNNYQE